MTPAPARGGAWLEAWRELGPAFAVVRLRFGATRLAWPVPLWPFEEVLTWCLGAASLVPWRAVRDRVRRGTPELPAGVAASAWQRLDDLAAGARPSLRLRRGEAYLSLRTDALDIEVVAL